MYSSVNDPGFTLQDGGIQVPHVVQDRAQCLLKTTKNVGRSLVAKGLRNLKSSSYININQYISETSLIQPNNNHVCHSLGLGWKQIA
jgi:hypothetical protein